MLSKLLILIGFSTLMFGMSTMSGAVSPLRESQAFIDLFTTFSRPVIGIVTKCDEKNAKVEMAYGWLKEAGCDPIFCVDSVTGRGISDILDYLNR